MKLAEDMMTRSFMLLCCWLPGLACAQVAGQVPTPATAASAAPVLVTVRAYEVTGNSLLPFLDIQRALEPFKGPRTLEEIQAATRTLQALYAQHGWGGVVVTLPPQRRNDGVITLQVVEGKIGNLSVRGNRYASAANALASVPALMKGNTPKLSMIDLQLQLANDNPAKKTRVLLKPGARPGETDAELIVRDQKPRRWLVGVDNTGNGRTGHFRSAVTWQHANLSDRDDVLSLQYQTSPTKPGKVKVGSVAYHLPMYRQLTTLDAYAAGSDIDGGTTTTAAGDIRFNGSGSIFGLRATRLLPRWQELDHRLALTLDRRTYRNRCDIVGLPAGACGTGAGEVTVQPLTLDYILQHSGRVPVLISASLLKNLPFGGRNTRDAAFTGMRAEARRHYMLWRLGLSTEIAIADNWSIRGRGSAQLTRDALVPGEQFGIGGLSSVRGYLERELAGDNGYMAAIELVTPELLSSTDDAPSLHLLSFADAGSVRNNEGTSCGASRARCSAASWGIGARFAWRSLEARLDLARAQRAAVETQAGDGRAHVAVNYAF